MSGRLCSSACADFFERDPVSAEKPPQRRHAHGDTLLGQRSPKFGQGDVRLAVHQAQDQIRMALDATGSTIPAQRTGPRIALRSHP